MFSLPYSRVHCLEEKEKKKKEKKKKEKRKGKKKRKEVWWVELECK
jgi:hypothetical protein